MLRLARRLRCFGLVKLLIMSISLFLFIYLFKLAPEEERKFKKTKTALTDDDLVYYKKDIPMIWIGGVPRSGTTLMRAILDAHPDVRCGEETRVIPRILAMHNNMMRSGKEEMRLNQAKITADVLDSALGAYILSIVAKHGHLAPRLCNKDPFTLRSMGRLLKVFPQSKFVFMVRDGRATAHSIIARKVTIRGFKLDSIQSCIKEWNRAISSMYNECKSVGRDTCIMVYYEQLVLHPEKQIRRVLDFLDIRWHDQVMHHEQMIGQSGGISLSKKEPSTDQVNKPVNTLALTKWVPHIPPDVRLQMRELAPMLSLLGYDPDAYPPHYGVPDSIVANQSLHLQMAQGTPS